jgi:pyruvate, water dikinase
MTERAMSGPVLTKRLEELASRDRPTVGGKGASLGELTQAGIEVPGGYVVTTAAYAGAIGALDPDGALRDEIGRLPADDLATVDRVTGELRARILEAELPDDLQAAITGQYDLLGDPAVDAAVAVRSSATAEDGAEASFAGLQDTYLYVRGAPSVLEHVRRCWASLFSVESVTYRRRREVSERGLEMAVVIQHMVDARVSGVMFTCSPTTGDRSVVAIEASWGLGSAMVGGEVTPDSYLVNKVTGEVLRREISAKRRRHRMDPSGAGVLEEDVPEELHTQPCLTESRLEELVAIAKRVEKHYGCPQDIEWAEAATSASILLLQSRPETVWANRQPTSVAAPKARAFDHVLGMMSGGARPADGAGA